MMSLVIRNLVFTAVVPGAGAVWVPWWILTRFDTAAAPTAWYAVIVIAAGAALYLWCVAVFAVVGRGTPGPWDAPRRFVAVGPYRWVRNPMYHAVLLVILGEAWLFLSPPLLVYAATLLICFHLFVIGYEEPTLRRRFGASYTTYVQAIPRWLPRRPRS
jgi:protein-S-isoprenylcysteine O-methyltransferase Ste14